jgi:CSLREA domain-containing protein
MRINYSFFSQTKRTRRTLGLAFGLAMIFVLLLFSLQAATKPAHAVPTTFTVNSMVDPGNGVCNVTQCTLREAIDAANTNPGADTIEFDIPGAGPHTISPVGSSLPEITKPVTIDGYSEPGATENTVTEPRRTNAVLKIQLSGSNGVAVGLTVGDGSGSSVSNVVIRGLAISNFGEGILFLSSGSANRVEGNFIGTDPSGTSAEGNEIGVHSSVADGITLGGTSPPARNLISGNDLWGVWLEGGATGNTIEGNLIGTDKDAGSLGNGDVGVNLSSSGNGNRILSNSIFFNGGLGIDLGFDGVTPNDGDKPLTPEPDPDSDTGPNDLQNFPVISSAVTSHGLTTITGALNSTPKKSFTLQFFSSRRANPSGFGEGKTFLGDIQVTTNRNGSTGIFTFEPEQTVAVGQKITATATMTSTGDTSEFSRAKPVVQ